jgi:acetone carboxylase gamma subunit
MEPEQHEQHHPRERIRALVERRLDWRELQVLQRGEKDPDRFDRYLEVLQERVPWPERILLPIHEHLFIVAKEGRAVTKSLCGVEFGEWREHWKLRARIRVRRTREELLEVYADNVAIDPSVVEIREFVCPGCGTLLDVDAVPPHYPIEREFFPDLRTFYEEWLGRALPIEVGAFEDRSLEVVRAWAAGKPPDAAAGTPEGSE